jgi:hypothetical protein
VAVFRRVRGRKWQNRTLFAVVLIVMALFGLWHGGAWHFVLFGVAQGFVIAGWAVVTKGRAPRSRLGWITSLLALQASWLFSLILFRGDSLPAIGQFLGGLGREGWIDPALRWCSVAMTATILVQAVDYYVHRRPIARVLRALRGTALGTLAVAVVFAGALALKISIDAKRIAAGGSGQPSESFIYFRF